MSKVVLITGGTQGIGQETSELLASQGWKVVVSGRNKENGEKVVSGIKANGGDATYIFGDVGSQSDVKELHTKVIAAYGRLDGAVNAAGISTDGGLFSDLKTDEFEKMWRVNVLGVFWCMQEQIRIMKPQGSGHIINLASIAGLHGIPWTGTYCATKHAVVGLTRTAALDYATTGISINAVAPGAIKTTILDDAISKGIYSEDTIAGMFPVKRMGKPIDIAKGISFLLGSEYVTGSVLEIDGGLGAA